MKNTNPQVDAYIDAGCGRCELYATPRCKVKTWQHELIMLREIILSCGLTETLKWKQPCYTFENKNVLILTAFKEYCAVAFFKGTLLKDPQGILISPGEHSQAVKQLRFTSVEQIAEQESMLKTFIGQAIEIEKAGTKIKFKKQHEQVFPEELKTVLEENHALKEAFYRLTPGRQRGYMLFFAAPKKTETRIARIQKSIPKILAGKGINE